MRQPLAVLIVATVLLSGCSASSPSASSIPTSPQERFSQAVAQSEGIPVTAAVSQMRCAKGSLQITGQTQLPRPEDGELYVIITVGCRQDRLIGAETAEVIHWWSGGWDSVGTIGMSKTVWNVTGECRTQDATTVMCPVKMPPNPTRPDTGTLQVSLVDSGFSAEIVYSEQTP